MKKIFLIIGLLWVLNGCVDANPKYIQIELNPGIDTIEIGVTYEDPGAKASYGVVRLEMITIINQVDTNTVGIYEIIYQATYQNFSKTVKRIVTVVDRTPPKLTLNPGIDTLYEGEVWVDQGVTIVELSNKQLTIEVIGSVSSLAGVYEVTYRVTDDYGNIGSIKRIIHVLKN